MRLRETAASLQVISVFARRRARIENVPVICGKRDKLWPAHTDRRYPYFAGLAEADLEFGAPLLVQRGVGDLL